MSEVEVIGGEKKYIEGCIKDSFSYLSTDGSNIDNIDKKIKYNDKLKAPIKKGQVIGCVEYYLDGNIIGKTDILAKESVEKAGFKFVLFNTLKKMLL